MNEATTRRLVAQVRRTAEKAIDIGDFRRSERAHEAADRFEDDFLPRRRYA